MSGGALGQYLYNRDKRYQCLLMGGSTILAVFPMLYLINTNRVGDPFFYIVSFLSGVIISANGPNVRSVLQVRIQYNILYQCLECNTIFIIIMLGYMIITTDP